jgi:hypothetical protein
MGFYGSLGIRVTRFFLIHFTKTGKNVPNEYQKYQMTYIPNVSKMLQMATKYIIFSNPRPRKIYPNWDFLV